MQLSVVIEGEQLLSRRLQGLATDLENLQQPLTTSADTLVQFFSGEVFDTEGAVIGMPWEPLRPSTIAQKLRQGFTEQPLVRTGRMQDGFESVVSSNQAVISNSAPYFPYHQSNQPRHSNLPRRVMMALDDMRKETIVKIFQEYILGLVKGSV